MLDLKNSIKEMKVHWPQGFRKLRHFSVNCYCHRLGLSNDIRISLRSLPMTLEALDLEFVEVEVLFHEFERIYEFWDLNASFPHLKSLRVRTTNPIWHKTHFSLFPSGLKSLTLDLPPLNDEYQRWDDLSTLPRSLTYFNPGNRQEISPKCFATLPPSLTLLDTHLRDECAVEALQLKSLQHLKVSSPRIENLLKALKDGSVACSTSLRAIDIVTSAAFELLPLLPSWITQLELYSTILNLEHIKMLPSQLTALYISSCGPWEEIESNLWPNRLAHLHLKDEFISPAEFCKLPRTLKSLLLVGKPEFLSSEDQWCANGRSALIKDLQLSTSALCTAAPHMQTNSVLDETWIDEAMKVFNVRPGSELSSAIKNGRLYGLPLGITRLDCILEDKNRDYRMAFPPVATEIRLSSSLVRAEMAQYFRTAPSSAQVIVLKGEEMHVLRVKNWLILTNRLVCPEATQLTSFEITSCFFDPTWFKTLPRSLISLTIDFLDASRLIMRPEDVLNLPPHLTSISVLYKTKYDKPWLHLLPRTLTSFYGKNSSCQASELSQLPSGLKSLMLGQVRSCTLKLLSTLPRRLQYIVMNAIPSDYKEIVVKDSTTLPPRTVLSRARLGSFYSVLKESGTF